MGWHRAAPSGVTWLPSPSGFNPTTIAGRLSFMREGAWQVIGDDGEEMRGSPPPTLPATEGRNTYGYYRPQRPAPTGSEAPEHVTFGPDREAPPRRWNVREHGTGGAPCRVGIPPGSRRGTPRGVRLEVVVDATATPGGKLGSTCRARTGRSAGRFASRLRRRRGAQTLSASPTEGRCARLAKTPAPLPTRSTLSPTGWPTAPSDLEVGGPTSPPPSAPTSRGRGST